MNQRMNRAPVRAWYPAGMTTLGIAPDQTQLLIDGHPTFLLGASYYGGLGASAAFIAQDLDDLQSLGFNWLRVWATWGAFDHNVSAIGPDGAAREPYYTRLLALAEELDRRGMVLDVTLSRRNAIVGTGLMPDLSAHLAIADGLTRALQPFRNIYFDLANERNKPTPSHPFAPIAELQQVARLVKEHDPERLLTTSYAGDLPREEVEQHLQVVGVDLLTPHRLRRVGAPAQTAAQTRQYATWMQELGRVVPVHYQEPLRRAGGRHYPRPEAGAFLEDLTGAVKGGAAGWCFHNGHDGAAPDGRPRRSFDLREAEGRLFDQLDAEERVVVAQASAVVSG